MATLIHPDGTQEEVSPKDQAWGFSVEEIETLIGNGCEETWLVNLGDGKTSMWIGCYSDESSIPPNLRATEMLKLNGGHPGKVVVGNVVITKGDGEGGDQ